MTELLFLNTVGYYYGHKRSVDEDGSYKHKHSVDEDGSYKHKRNVDEDGSHIDKRGVHEYGSGSACPYYGTVSI